MSDYRILFTDWKQIRKLLLEIGQYEYEAHLERQGYLNQKPMDRSFFLEARPDCVLLCYRYPSRLVIQIMKVDKYDKVPKTGWELRKVYR